MVRNEDTSIPFIFLLSCELCMFIESRIPFKLYVQFMSPYQIFEISLPCSLAPQGVLLWFVR